MHFCQSFADKRLYTRCSTKGAARCSFCRAPYNSYFGKVFLRDFANTSNNLRKHWISAEVLLTEGYAQGPLRKGLLIAPFEEPLKMLLWERLTNRIYQCLTLHFWLVFTDRRLCARRSTKGVPHCYSGAVFYLNNYFGKAWLIGFIDTGNKKLICRLSADSKLCTRRSTKWHRSAF